MCILPLAKDFNKMYHNLHLQREEIKCSVSCAVLEGQFFHLMWTVTKTRIRLFNGKINVGGIVMVHRKARFLSECG